MLKRIEGWNDIDAAKYGDFVSIEPGFYPAVLLKVEQTQTSTGRDAVLFSFDIIDGKYVRYYEKDYKAQTMGDRKWRGTLQQLTDGKSAPFFKGLITAIEESNPGYSFDFDETKMKGLKVGIGIRREQFEATDGTLKFTTRPFTFCDIKKVITSEMQPPKDKLIQTSTQAPAGWSAPATGNTPPGYQTPAPTSAPSYPPLTELDETDELPF